MEHYKLHMAPALSVLLLGLSSVALGVPITYDLQNVRFSDGGVAAGTFTYDAASNIFTNWSISVSGGDTWTFPAFTYDPQNSAFLLAGFVDGWDGFTVIHFANLQGPIDPRFNLQREFRLVFEPNLSDGTVTADFKLDSTMLSECYACGPYRSFVSGSVTGVPEPSVGLLFGSALIFLEVLARRRAPTALADVPEKRLRQQRVCRR